MVTLQKTIHPIPFPLAKQIHGCSASGNGVEEERRGLGCGDCSFVDVWEWLDARACGNMKLSGLTDWRGMLGSRCPNNWNPNGRDEHFVRESNWKLAMNLTSSGNEWLSLSRHAELTTLAGSDPWQMFRNDHAHNLFISHSHIGCAAFSASTCNLTSLFWLFLSLSCQRQYDRRQLYL